MSKRNKNLILSLAGFMMVSSVFSLFCVCRAQSEAGNVNFEKDSQETLKQLVSSSVPPNAFSGLAEQDLKMVPAYMLPSLANYKLTFNQDSKKTFQKGETVNLSGTLIYSSENLKERFEDGKKQCLEKVKNKSEEEKIALCSSPEILNIPIISNGGIIVDVWRKDETNERTKKGDYLVDEFYIAEGLNLIKDNQNQINLNWKVPEDAISGSYYFSFFVNSNKKFPLSGFLEGVFSPRVVYGFDVKGNEKGGVEVDKNNIKINGINYSQVNPVPTTGLGNEDIKVDIPIVNLSSNDQEVKVKYELFRWMQEDPGNILERQEKIEKIPAGGKNLATFSFQPNTLDSVYDLRVTVETTTNKSMTNIHFALANKHRGIFMFLGTAEKGNGKIVPIFCVRDAQWNGYFQGKVRITLFDDTNKNIGSWEKDGNIEPINGSCFIVETQQFDVLNSQNQSNLKLKGEILNLNNEKVDECLVNIQKKNATEIKENVIGGLSYLNENKTILLLGIIGIIILVIVVLVVINYLNKKKNV